MKRLCFVLMPFGKKLDPGGGSMIDFDRIYKSVIEPAIVSADLDPIRADEEVTGGLIHRAMFERLILCEFAVADLTTANANVYYELGIRHALLPHTTVLIFAGHTRLPFDVSPLRAIPYEVSGGIAGNPEAAKKVIANRLLEARKPTPDSPLFQLVENFPDIQRLKTDVFRDRVEYVASTKRRLAAARRSGSDEVCKVETELGDLVNTDSAVVVDLFLSYRATEAWKDMVRVVERMSKPLAASVLVQEQLAFAENRLGNGEEAERILKDLLENKGPSSETYGLLGRVYKDRWEKARDKGDKTRAVGLLDKAISAYVSGFETDWRDAYPGINAVTLMELRQPPDPRRLELLPVVKYANVRRMAGKQPDYWDYATSLELGVLEKDREASEAALGAALANIRESWESKTTLRNLGLIRSARETRGEDVSWLKDIINELESSGK